MTSQISPPPSKCEISACLPPLTTRHDLPNFASAIQMRNFSLLASLHDQACPPTSRLRHPHAKFRPACLPPRPGMTSPISPPPSKCEISAHLPPSTARHDLPNFASANQMRNFGL